MQYTITTKINSIILKFYWTLVKPAWIQQF